MNRGNGLGEKTGRGKRIWKRKWVVFEGPDKLLSFLIFSKSVMHQ